MARIGQRPNPAKSFSTINFHQDRHDHDGNDDDGDDGKDDDDDDGKDDDGDWRETKSRREKNASIFVTSFKDNITFSVC